MAIMNNEGTQPEAKKAQVRVGEWAGTSVTVHKVWLKTGREAYLLHTSQPVSQVLVHGKTNTLTYSLGEAMQHKDGWLVPLSPNLIKNLVTKKAFSLVSPHQPAPFQCEGRDMLAFTTAFAFLNLPTGNN